MTEEELRKKVIELVDAHWEYIKGVLLRRSRGNLSNCDLDEIEYHYKTAMIHGYGHGWKDCEKSKE